MKPLLLLALKTLAIATISPGGYSPVDTTREDVMKVANYAVEVLNSASNSLESLALEKILKAETQVVAGTNFRLMLALDRTGKHEFREVVVFRSLSGELSLRSHNVVH